MTKNLLAIVNRTAAPAPWSEGDNIPWDDPGFSQRMLAEHLSQDHDLASRKSDRIDLQVAWIFTEVLGSRPARVLDLACGPGLYTSRLAARGCECVGIDFSPASIQHAQESAAGTPGCTYHHADLRDGRFGEGFDLVMMLYGQLNVFPRAVGLQLLAGAHAALAPQGRLVLEVQPLEQIRKGGQAPATWYSAPSGLFSHRPHLVLQESFWDEEAAASTLRFSAIDAETAQVETYALSNEAYTEEQLEEAVAAVGFNDIAWFGSLGGAAAHQEQALPVITARR